MGTPTFDYYIELFRHNFVEGRGKIGKTAFYGLGRQTEEILRAFPSFPVIGLLDGYREEGEIYGKEIISLASLAGQDVNSREKGFRKDYIQQDSQVLQGTGDISVQH